MNLQTRIFRLFSAAVIVLIALVGCAPAPVTALPEPTAVSSPTALPTATETPTPLPTDTPLATVTSSPIPEATPTLTAEQQKEYQKQKAFIEKWFTNDFMQMKPEQITIYPDPVKPETVLVIYPDPNNPGNALIKDNLTGRIIADGTGHLLYYNPDNTVGVDKLPDGTPVFNLNLVKTIQQDIQPGNWRSYEHTNSDSGAEDYCFKLMQEADYKNGPAISSEIGGIASGETEVFNSVYLGRNGNGTKIWGIIIAKRNKEGRIQGPRSLVYRTPTDIKHIQVYFPNYLFFF